MKYVVTLVGLWPIEERSIDTCQSEYGHVQDISRHPSVVSPCGSARNVRFSKIS